MKIIINFFIFSFILSLLQLTGQVAQAKKLSFVRDAETEKGISNLLKPLLHAAHLDADNIKIYIVKDPTLNAFVAGGPNIFIHTGLLTASRNASELTGVLAHEIGHISGGHLSRLAEAQRNASQRALIGSLIGGVAALLGGNPSAGTAIASSGQHIGMRSLLRFSRDQELSADRAALRYLDNAKQSAQGMLTFLELISDQELLSINNQDPYVRTHPPSQRRITYLRNHVQTSEFSEIPIDKNIQKIHSRIKAKITAFSESPEKTFRKYPSSNNSVAARYARAIAHYRNANVKVAISLIDELLKDFAYDPYFHELKGQILFEYGEAKKALQSYEEATRLLPETALIRAELGRIQLESNDTRLLHEAINNFQISLNKEPKRSLYGNNSE